MNGFERLLKYEIKQYNIENIICIDEHSIKSL